MSRQIWKYSVNPGSFSLKMPKDAVFRHVGVQSQKKYNNLDQEYLEEHAVMWFEVNDENKAEDRHFFTVPTGVDISVKPYNRKYLGTLLIQSGILVFHLFEDYSKE